MTLNLLTRDQLRQALLSAWPYSFSERTFQGIVRNCPKVVVPGGKRALFDLEAVLGWIRQQVVVGKDINRAASLHRSRARKSA